MSEYKPERYFNLFSDYKGNFHKRVELYECEHEDYREIHFIENEREFYTKLHYDLTSIVEKENVFIENIIKLAPNILEIIEYNDGEFNFKELEKFRATFKRIINYLVELEEVYKSKKISNNNANPKTIEKNNPYPRIFKDDVAYQFFMRLHNNYKDKKNPLANYSFIFQKMTYEGLIFPNIKHVEYLNLLGDLGIPIDRIKPLNIIGKKDERESFYNTIKSIK